MKGVLPFLKAKDKKMLKDDSCVACGREWNLNFQAEDSTVVRLAVVGESGTC